MFDLLNVGRRDPRTAASREAAESRIRGNEIRCHNSPSTFGRRDYVNGPSACNIALGRKAELAAHGQGTRRAAGDLEDRRLNAFSHSTRRAQARLVSTSQSTFGAIGSWAASRANVSVNGSAESVQGPASKLPANTSSSTMTCSLRSLVL
jgi:hypothetical protein